MMKALSIKKILIAMAITLVVTILPAAGINQVLAETAKTEEKTEAKKLTTVKKASNKKKETKKEETKKVSDENEKKVEEAKVEEQPAASAVQAQPQVQQTSQTISSNATYSGEPAHPVSEPIQGSIQVEQIPETSTNVQETTTPSSGIQVETPAPAPSQPSDGTEGVHQQPTVVVDEVVELN